MVIKTKKILFLSLLVPIRKSVTLAKIPNYACRLLPSLTFQANISFSGYRELFKAEIWTK